MKIRFLVLVNLLTTLTVSADPNPPPGGGFTDGGSTVCTHRSVNGGMPVLLDLVNVYPKVQDTQKGSYIQFSKKSQANLDVLGFDFIKKGEIAAPYQAAVQKLKPWEQAMPEYMAHISNAVKNMVLVKTDFRSNYVSGAVVRDGSLCTRPFLSPMIIYIAGWANIIVPTWNKTGLLSQTWAVVHEALRQVQILHGGKLTHGELQTLTAKLMTAKPGDPAATKLLSKLLVNKYNSAWLSQIAVEQKAFCENYPANKIIIKRLNKAYDFNEIDSQVATLCSMSPESLMFESNQEFLESMRKNVMLVFSSVYSLDATESDRHTLFENGSRIFLHMEQAIARSRISSRTATITDLMGAMAGIFQPVFFNYLTEGLAEYKRDPTAFSHKMNELIDEDDKLTDQEKVEQKKAAADFAGYLANLKAGYQQALSQGVIEK